MFILENITLSCGTTSLIIDSMIPNLVTTAVNIIKIVIPILLIIYGMLDLGKAVMAQKEDEIKKGQQTFVKRLIAAVIVFLVVFVVEIAIGLVAPRDSNENVWGCFNCLVNNECDPA